MIIKFKKNKTRVKNLYFSFLYFLLVQASCNIDHERNTHKTKVQYMPDMADSPIVKTQRDYLDPPEGSIPHNALLHPKTSEEAEKILKNPYRNSTQRKKHESEGKKLFEIHCYPCHGMTGKGDGPVTYKYPAPPDITTANYKKRGDGHFYHVILNGIRNMPKYGHAVSDHERWKIILHLRNLQNK